MLRLSNDCQLIQLSAHFLDKNFESFAAVLYSYTQRVQGVALTVPERDGNSEGYESHFLPGPAMPVCVTAQS